MTLSELNRYYKEHTNGLEPEDLGNTGCMVKEWYYEEKKETKLKVERHWLCEEQKTSKQKKHYILRS